MLNVFLSLTDVGLYFLVLTGKEMEFVRMVELVTFTSIINFGELSITGLGFCLCGWKRWRQERLGSETRDSKC